MRHSRDDLRLRRCDGAPGRLLGVLAGKAEHVDAAGELDQLRRPVARGEDRVEPLDRSDHRPLGTLHRHAHAIDASALAGDEVERGVARSRRRGDGADVAHRLADRLRIECDHLRARGDHLGLLDDFVVGDRADRAQLLGDDQVGLQLAQELGIELVDGALAGDRGAHGGVDLARRQALRQTVPGHAWQLERTCGMIALVRHRDDIVAEPEREEQLGCVRHERNDPHLWEC